jgi:hypothetical protein
MPAITDTVSGFGKKEDEADTLYNSLNMARECQCSCIQFSRFSTLMTY